MSEMLERGAKAIKAKVPIGYGMTDVEALAYARAVIEAIREPNAHMSVEGHDEAERALGAMFHSPIADRVWKRMIDAGIMDDETPKSQG